MILNVTEKELKVLLSLIDTNPCRAACVWEECHKESLKFKEDIQELYCDMCSFTMAKNTLEEKINILAEKHNIIGD